MMMRTIDSYSDSDGHTKMGLYNSLLILTVVFVLLVHIEVVNSSANDDGPPNNYVDHAIIPELTKSSKFKFFFTWGHKAQAAQVLLTYYSQVQAA
jgi:hypothetical protein